MLSWYCRYHEAYGWTVKEVDETELEIALDELLVLAKKNQTETENETHLRGYIEDVLPL